MPSATELPLWIEILISAFLLIGAAFALIGSWGLAKLPDFYTRLHGPSKASTLGVGGMLIASIVYFALLGRAGLHELLITLFLFISTPVSAHLLTKAALHLKLRSLAQQPPVKSGKGEGAHAGEHAP